MHIAPRVRMGLALHAAVNVVFGVAAVAPGIAANGVARAAVVGTSTSEAVPVALAPMARAMTAVTRSTTTTSTTTTVPPTTSTTTPAPSAAATAATAATTGAPAPRRVSSTGYCLEGTTASGDQVGHGGVAMNGVPLGSRWFVHDGPLAGTVLIVNDRIGWGSDFDIWFATCPEAVAYGRRTITVERVG